MGKRVRRPKRLYQAIVACGVGLTSCGGDGMPTDAGADAPADARSKTTDAGLGFDVAPPDNYVPMQDAAMDAIVIIMPSIH